MYFIKRALLSTWKHKVKNILLIVILTLIAVLLFCSITVNNAVKNVMDNAMRLFGAQVTVTFDLSKAKKVNYKGVEATTSSGIPTDTLKKLDSLKNVAAYNHVSILYAWARNFKPIFSEKDKEYFVNTNTSMPKNYDRQCTLLSMTDASRLSEFSSGTYRIVKGRNIGKTDEGKTVAVINENLAKKNNLKLKSKLTFENMNNPDASLTFTVVGIFKAPSAGIVSGGVINDSNNTVYIPFSSDVPLARVPGDTVDDFTAAAYAIYYIDDPQNVASFKADAKKISGMDDFLLTANNKLYARKVSTLSSTRTLSLLMTVITILAGCLIFALVIALSLKGRRREFGILLAVGEKKPVIILQVLLETLVPVVIAFCIGIFASGIISQKICDRLVDNSVTTVQKQDNMNSNNVNYLMSHKNDNGMALNMFDETTVKPINSVDVSVTLLALAEFTGSGLLIVLISVLFPVMKILRLSPMEILLKKE